MNRLRRALLAAFAASPAAAQTASVALAKEAAAKFEYPAITPRSLAFPRDFGAHPDFRTEWWYLTGWLDAPTASREPPLGVQLTFFRIRPPIDAANPSRFAARQLVLAHAALADPRRGALLHEERIARAGFGIADASEPDTDVQVDRWRLAREAGSGVYRGIASGSQFTLEIAATPTQPPLLQGQDGYSRKGPCLLCQGPGGQAANDDTPASLYYSQPQLALQARVTVGDATFAKASAALADGAAVRSGRGWLDHEWSSTLLPPQAAGWDWVGFNLDDGAALTAFRIRRAGGDDPWFAYASLRAPGRPVQTFEPAQVRFEPRQRWTSARTRAVYPVAQSIVVGSRHFETRPLMADQELDARAAGGMAYWEGASELLEGGRVVGRGYLELTGYAGPLPASMTG